MRTFRAYCYGCRANQDMAEVPRYLTKHPRHVNGRCPDCGELRTYHVAAKNLVEAQA